MSLVKTKSEQTNSKVGSGIGESNCQKPVAIYPVRYSVIPSANGSKNSFEGLSPQLDGSLPNLEKAKYALRTLRPESYVYIYNENSQNPLTCFFYSKDHLGISSPRFYYVANLSEKAIILSASLDYVWADCNKNKKFTTEIQMGYTDAPPSPRTCKNLLKDKALRDQLLPTKIDIKKWQDGIKKALEVSKLSDINNKFINTYDPKIPNTFYPSATALKTHVTDFSSTNLTWSETPKVPDQIGIIKSGMQITNPHDQISVALYDPIGLSSELNNLTADEYYDFQSYVDEQAHPVASAKSLISFLTNKDTGESLKAAIKAEGERTRKVQNVYRNSQRKWHGDASETAIIERAKEKLAGEVSDYASQLRTDKAGLEDYLNGYQKELKSKDRRLKRISADAMVWAHSLSVITTTKMAPAIQKTQSISDALHFYDRVMFDDETYDDADYLKNWAAYGMAVYRILGTLPLIKEGEQLVGELIAGDLEQNPFWISLAKRNETENTKNSAWNYVRNPTDGVFGVLVMAIGDKLFSNRQIEFTTKNLISLMNSTMNHWYNKKELIKFRLRAFIPKSEVPDFLKSTPLVNKLTQVKSNQKTIQQFNKRAAIRLRTLGNPKVNGVFAAVIAVVTIIDFSDTFADYKTGPEGEHESLTAISSGLGATSAVLIMTSAGIDAFDKGGYLDKQLEKILGKRVSGAKFLAGIGGAIGAGSALVGASVDAKKSLALFRKGDSDSAVYTAASSVVGLLNAGATGAVSLIGLSAAFNGAALGGLVATSGGALTVIGLTAFAWATLGLGLFVGVLVLAYLAANAADKPIEIWLQQTYWGIKPRYKSNIEEIDAMNNLMYRPYVEANWNDLIGTDVLELQITLPYYVEGKSTFELKENVTMDGKIQTKVQNRRHANYKDNSYAMSTKLVEQGNGFAKYEVDLALDDDAIADITLDYYPDKVNHPNIKISGHPTGKTWTFKDDGIFSDTIDDDEFNSRVDDRR